ncbi:MAG TPA: lipocalin-like domain-containing protein [Accumulibacter sp.]|uniref:lipocalin-like domain-containing protein n=1 Tax=Accumulibacter sp. TaxID=2053492 RepID=UPI002BD531B9|nr:lipocalin-like domain-containing protein [Accumulibacter sp.]HRD89280.1 lipocalin-like domain-containing protein [Accumulibacter sp.]
MHRRSFLATPLLLPSLTGTAALAAAVDYPAAEAGIELIFPRDHGAHPDFRTEWWYVTGALDAPEPDIGFQLTFFRSRPGIAEGLRSPIAARQIVFAHAALTIPGERLQHAERAARANLGAGFASHDLDVSIGAWRMFRQEIDGRESLQLRMQDPKFSWELSLSPSQPLLLQGDAGHSRKGHAPGLASHYVSWPQLRVTGTMLRQGRRQAVDGRAWFDHEWSTALLGDGAVGWDWLGINLADGGALMAFRMRDVVGTTLYAHAAWRDAGGRLQQFTSEQVYFTPLRHWQSPRNGARYPVQIEVRFGEHSIRTRPVVDDQELSTTLPTPVSYWEGLVRVEGSLSGRGYLEMTGYAGRLRVGGAAGGRLPA